MRTSNLSILNKIAGAKITVLETRSHIYDRLIEKLTIFLITYKISLSQTNIFVESLLKMAGIAIQKQHGKFGMIDESRMYIALSPMGQKDVKNFMTYLKNLGSESTIYHFNQEQKIHYFSLYTMFVFSKIIPQFQKTITQLPKSKELEKYQLASINSAEILADNLISHLTYFSGYIKVDKKFRYYYAPERNSLLYRLEHLKSAILPQLLKKTSFKNLIDSYQLFLVSVKQFSLLQNDSKTQFISEEVKKYCTYIKKYSYSPREPLSLKFALAKSASHLQIVSKGQLGLPDEIHALIAAFDANPARGLCQFGENGKIIYPGNSSRHIALENYEQAVFKFFKTIAGKPCNGKKIAFLDQQFDDYTKKNQL